MKKTLYNKLAISMIGCLFMVLGGLVSQGWALPLPMLDFVGVASTTVDNVSGSIIDKSIQTGVTNYVDKDNNNHDIFPFTQAPNDDPILGQPVYGAMPSGISYDWANDILTIDPNASAIFGIGSTRDIFLTASVTNITATRIGTANYLIHAILVNQTLNHLNDSTFMAQYNEATGGIGKKGQLITWDFVFNKTPVDTDNDGAFDATKYDINVNGKLAPVPEPATILLFGTGLIGIAGFARKKVKKA